MRRKTNARNLDAGFVRVLSHRRSRNGRGDGMAKAARRAYVPPYELVRKRLGFESRERARAEVTVEQVEGALRLLLPAVSVDESLVSPHLSRCRRGDRRRDVQVGARPFRSEWLVRGPTPVQVEVDEDWYLATYDDVAEGVETGEIASATEHFRRHGYKEGRLPHEP